MFAPRPSLHFSVHLSFLVISCFYNRVLQCLKLFYTGKENQSMHSKIGFDASTFKVEENSRTFQGLTQKFNDFSRKNGIQGLPLKFKDFSRLCEPCCHMFAINIYICTD